jgi:hypothetical protein
MEVPNFMFYLRRNGFLIGYCWAALGCGLLLTGLTVDLAHHASQHVHTDRVFDFSNPGHIIAIVGIYNLAAGLVFAGSSRWVVGRLSLTKSAGLLSGVLILAASFSLLIVHLDSKSAAGESSSVEAATAHGHGNSGNGSSDVLKPTLHEAVNNAPVTPENLSFAADFLAKARDATAKYKDVNVAEQDGYIRITQYLPVIGAHFLNPGFAGRRLDPAHPPILLYQQATDGSWVLAGVAYLMPKRPGVEAPPSTPLGSLAQWHYHSDLCFDLETLAVSAAASATQCQGRFADETPWLLHAWIWIDSPEGVFSHANSLLQ